MSTANEETVNHIHMWTMWCMSKLSDQAPIICDIESLVSE